MDLGITSDATKVALFQKVNLNCLIRVRKTCESLDKLVEEYRHEIAKKSTNEAFLFEVVLKLPDESDVSNANRIGRFSIASILGIQNDDQAINKEAEQAVLFEFSVKIDTDLPKITITDPYKQLSAIRFEEIRVINQSTREVLFGKKLEDALQNTLFPLLKKMKSQCASLLNTELPTNTVFELALLTRCHELGVESKLGNRSDLNISEIFQNENIQDGGHLVLFNCMSDTIEFPGDLINHFPFFLTLAFTDIQYTFVLSMINLLCELTDFGRLEKIRIQTSEALFDDPCLLIPNCELLFYAGDYPDHYGSLRLFEGVSKWIACLDYKYPEQKHKIRIYFLDKNPSLLLDNLIEVSLPVKVDASSIREEFINAETMWCRYQIFQQFHERTETLLENA